MRLSPADEAQIAALLELAFDDGGFDGRSYYQQRHHVRLVARSPGQIVGHMALSIRDIRLGADLVTVIGLADVATHPYRRGEGIASALLHACIVEARQTTAAFFMLFGDAEIYAGNGFVPVGNSIRYISLLGARTDRVFEKPNRGLMVMPLGDLPWNDAVPVDLLGHPV